MNRLTALPTALFADPWELLRRAVVYGAALTLIAACTPLPGPL